MCGEECVVSSEECVVSSEVGVARLVRSVW